MPVRTFRYRHDAPFTDAFLRRLTDPSATVVQAAGGHNIDISIDDVRLADLDEVMAAEGYTRTASDPASTPVTQIRIADGTILNLAALTDGQTLIRSGSTIAGSSSSVGANSITDTEIDKATPSDVARKTITFSLDGRGQIPTPGRKGPYFRVPWDVRIIGWSIVANTVGSCVVDVWYAEDVAFPPTNSNSIVGTEAPTLSSAQRSTDLTLTTWTTVDLNRGAWLAFEVESASTVSMIQVELECRIR